MTHHNWLVTDDGQYHAFGHPNVTAPGRYYRIYRFLTELEDILETFHDDTSRLEAITPLVRKLLASSHWLTQDYGHPSATPGSSTRELYQEPDFPLTVQMEARLPGHGAAIHNQGTWGIVAQVKGQEHYRLWQRQPQVDYPDHIGATHDIIVHPGDVVALTANAIHSTESLGDGPTLSFHLYGEVGHHPRYRFCPTTHTAQPF